MKITKASAYALHALMYMVRHATQLPVTAAEIAKGEGIPRTYLLKVLQQLSKTGFVRKVRGHSNRYTLAKPAEDISMLELLEAMEGKPLFQDCPLKHCQCGGTTENCYIYAQWVSSTKKMRNLLSETDLVTASWNHPEHRFYSLPTEDDERAHKLTESLPGG